MTNFDVFPSDSPESAEEEKFPQMSEADIEEMRGQVPILKEMLEERKSLVARLETNPDALSTAMIDRIKIEIKELELEIEGREE
jgi:hypothetical protein